MVYDSVCQSVCNDLGLSVMTMSPAKTAEPTDTWTRVGPVNCMLDVGLDHPIGRGTFEGMTLGFPCMPPSHIPSGCRDFPACCQSALYLTSHRSS